MASVDVQAPELTSYSQSSSLQPPDHITHTHARIIYYSLLELLTLTKDQTLKDCVCVGGGGHYLTDVIDSLKLFYKATSATAMTKSTHSISIVWSDSVLYA